MWPLVNVIASAWGTKIGDDHNLIDGLIGCRLSHPLGQGLEAVRG